MKKYLILISLILFNLSFSGENNIIKGNPNNKYARYRWE